MPKRSGGPSIPLLREPGAGSGRPLYRQLYRRIREAILRGAIPPGTRLPSARTLAREEGISRNTVEAAVRQLRAEGFVVRRVGSGTWVAEDLPER
ncbi:MAG: GntR family transcriptional regulator, partial [Gemmatimonadota bacterium]